ncbi:hypothetical protein Cob_v011769 [Colletotrichum orbiculare MAFF 240422]|uniref:Stress-response A/B barrel domain-containing protein n=1 Tax=Colletotrichum orbiculare (strain 104-T / ATCC 96160 / CBS 514.97 / LARS 414 / MAFF 240422) TaxID=1213857 RepID=A0A484FE21_COLOR|nr:hypothetical protein Cob_v011769 [Colletotrichum orbiculare MAFF 240422]
MQEDVSGDVRDRLITSSPSSPRDQQHPFTITNTRYDNLHKALVPQEEVKAICDAMLGLKEKCIQPTSQQQYVKSMVGGLENSPEGLQDGITHVFVAEFESAEDREYYLHKDPAHLAFVQEAGKVALKVRVVDFTPGAF